VSVNLCSFCGEREHSGNCDREQLKRVIRDLSEANRQLLALDAARQKIDMPGVIMIRSLISHRTQKPRIDIQLGDIHTQMDADSAMDVAKNIIECCEGAYADAFIFHFLTESLKQSPETAGSIIVEFREYREKLAEEFRQLQSGKEGM
jgi:hypothetical protein